MMVSAKVSCRLVWMLAVLWLLATGVGVAAVPAGSSWIGPTLDEEKALGVFDFRKIIDLEVTPTRCVLNVSADNRFQLFVNGRRVGEGPARGDLQHWRYERFEVGPLLHRGRNVIAARVWNFGDQSPAAQISHRTGFLLWAADGKQAEFNSNASWQVRAESAWRYASSGPMLNSLTGPVETVDGAAYDWRWMEAGDAAGWSAAVVIASPQFAISEAPAHAASKWMLVEDALPPMESKPESAGVVVRQEGVSEEGFPEKPLTVPAHTHASLLLDRGILTTAYPELAVSDGAGATVRVTYAEALYDDHGEKGNRNQIAGKHMDPRMMHDVFLPSGSAEVQTFEPLWWRTWRYVQVDVDTKDKPLTLHTLHARTTWYPFVERATFHSSDPTLEDIWQVGWRTARVNAHETYMDCPYWEQTQYVGDTRIEALVSYVMSGDDRLARQALVSFADSALPSGLTQSSFPVHGVQIIPPFSLLWIGMVHDFWMYRPDTADGVRELLPQTHAVLEYFEKLQRPDGLLGKLPENGFGLWNFLDWTKPYPMGAPPQNADGGSVPLSLQLAAALQDEADLEDAYGDRRLGADDRAAAGRITTAVFAKAWDARVGLLADTPGGRSFSQHANILGVYTGAIPSEQRRAVLERILQQEPGGRPVGATPELAPASYYFRFYLSRALDRAGMDDIYLATLWPWRHMLDLGLTTWAEQPEPTRSDAHAWSAHPNYDLLTLVAGIRPDAPGFASVLIEPHLGNLTSLDASMPHPLGDIHVSYRRDGDDWNVVLTLPQGLQGRFKLGSSEQALHGGVQHLRVSAR